MMTLVFLDCLRELGVDAFLVDRRFSKKVGDVGRFSLLKVLSSFGLLARLFFGVVRHRPRACVLFITNRPASFIIDWLMTELLRLLKLPVVLYVHTTGYSALAARNWVFGNLVRRALSVGHTTVCLGDSLVSDVSWATTGRLATIPNTPYRLPATLRASSSPRALLFLSNLIPGKGSKAFVEAALEVSQTHPRAKFIVAGDAPDPDVLHELAELIGGSPAKDRITLAGKADEELKWRLLQESYALVFPSTYAFEAQPLTIVEAMAAGLPVIAYDVGGIRDLVVNNTSGLLLEANDAVALRNSMRSILNDESLRRRLGANARELYELRFSPAAYMSAWEDVIRYLPHSPARQKH